MYHQESEHMRSKIEGTVHCIVKVSFFGLGTQVVSIPPKQMLKLLFRLQNEHAGITYTYRGHFRLLEYQKLKS